MDVYRKFFKSRQIILHDVAEMALPEIYGEDDPGPNFINDRGFGAIFLSRQRTRLKIFGLELVKMLPAPSRMNCLPMA